MENELNRLIEQQNQEYEIETHQLEDDTQSNYDIDDFEQRLKANKSRMFNDDDSDSDEDFRPPTSNAKKTTYQPYQPPKQSRPLLSEEPDLLRQVQQMHQNKGKETMQNTKKQITVETTKTRQEAQQRAEDEKLLELLNSNNTGLKDKKLKELIQKNKELYVNLEKEKTMRQKLQKEIEKIKEETDMHLSAMGVKVSKGNDKPDDSMDWKKKYNDLERKLQEVKLANTTIKNDYNKAMRVITREIGDNVSVDAVLSEDNTWKGRAQQIEVLKARVKELQAKMSSKGFSDMSYMTDRTQNEMGMMGTGKSFTAGGKAKDRREELENVKIQCESLKAENDALNEKMKALNSRKTVLEKENREMKGEFDRARQILKEKSENDDKYIVALKKEVERLKDKSPGVQTRIVYRDKPTETKRTENEEQDENLAKKELFVLKNELDKKEKIIKELISDKLRTTTKPINKENVIQENMPDQEKVLKLETMIKLLKQENEELSNMKLGIKAATPDSKVIKDLSLQNAQLRRKVDDLQQKLKAS